jgi:putative addiction module CopG family antidote
VGQLAAEVYHHIKLSYWASVRIFPRNGRKLMRLIHLTREAAPIVDSRVHSGQYASASQVICSALGLLERQEREKGETMAVLRSEIEEGLASGNAEPGVKDRILAYIDELAAEIGAQEEQCEPIA